MRILIVDDDEMSLSMLENALQQAGHEVQAARSGDQALRILEAGTHRLVVSDWEMPGMDGLALCRAIRSGDFGGYVYTILLTGREGAQDTVVGLSAGADDFITKPFNPAELAVRVHTGERILSIETRDLAIFAMAKLAESRDPETGAHLDRVRNYSKILALALAGKPGFEGVDPAYARLIYLTSPLHDIGKVAIPDCVLLKPGRLSDREFEIMKSHTTLGAQTLDAALEAHPEAHFLRMARDIAACHHERWDGGGYPSGLKAKDIPLCARIVAVADVYDALTSKRVYKSAFTHEVARSILLGDAGTHFDPDIIIAFQAQEQEFIEIQKRFTEAQAAAA
ncbi:MAG TPA: HD domain-containing phosphohydrolase [Tepidisphaeraceae bacterium]